MNGVMVPERQVWWHMCHHPVGESSPRWQVVANCADSPLKGEREVFVHVDVRASMSEVDMMHCNSNLGPFKERLREWEFRPALSERELRSKAVFVGVEIGKQGSAYAHAVCRVVPGCQQRSDFRADKGVGSHGAHLFRRRYRILSY